DGGATWGTVGAGVVGSRLAIDPSTTGTVYVVGFTGGPFAFTAAIARSTDGGQTFAPIAAPAASALFDIAMDAAAPGLLFVATDAASGVWSDAGAPWSDASVGLPATAFRSIAIDPAVSTSLYAAAFSGGVYKSVDAGAHWSAANDGIAGASASSRLL